MTPKTIATVATLSLVAGGAMADDHMTPRASAQVSGAGTELAGTVTLNDTASGRVLVQMDLTGVPEGTHAVHLHETGDCSADDFTSAGGHVAGDAKHGVLVEGGPHPGDMPNMVVGSDGVLKGEVFLSALDIDGMIFDADGAAFVMHDGADDYASQPAGDAGSRIACGVFEEAG